NRPHYSACQRIIRSCRIWRFISPNDPQRGHLISRTIKAALIDGIANLNIEITVAMGAHVARRGEACEEICLDIEYSHEECVFTGLVWSAVVEHMGMRIDEAGQDRRPAEVDHSNSRGNFELRLRSRVGDFVASNEHYLFGQHLAGFAVKQPAG